MTSPKKSSRYLPDHEDFSYEEFPFYWLARVHSVYALEMEKVLKKLGTDIPARRVLLTKNKQVYESKIEVGLDRRASYTVADRKVQFDASMRVHGLFGRMTELTDRIQEATKKIFVKGYTGLSDAQLQKLTQTLQVVFRNFTDD